jgi:hypothetical protein
MCEQPRKCTATKLLRAMFIAVFNRTDPVGQ